MLKLSGVCKSMSFEFTDIDEVIHNLKVTQYSVKDHMKLIELQKAVSEIALELKLANDQTTIKRLSATIRLMGYSVVAKAVWCRDSQNSTRQATVKPKFLSGSK